MKRTTLATYDAQFWNVMRGLPGIADIEEPMIDRATGELLLPDGDTEKLDAAINGESVFRSIATVVGSYDAGGRIFAHDTDDIAAWVPEGGSIPIQDGMKDFTIYPVDSRKLAVLVKLTEEFVNDSAFFIEDYLIKRLGRSFGRAEDAAFLTGTGDTMPTGILNEDTGAETAVSAASITYDDIIRLYYSLDKEYRRNAVWLMNDETALALRLLKDSSGNYLWDSGDGTILGKPVQISYDMPSASAGNMPVLFGDFSYYWIILRRPVGIRVLNETFAKRGQVGYLASEFLDGKLIRRDAVKALKITG
jgi:HK97 family phage major capsid protein